MSFRVTVIVLCVPTLLLIAAMIALASRKWILAGILGLVSVALAAVLGFVTWQVYVAWHPTPDHVQDADDTDPERVTDRVPYLGKIAVDHIFWYKPRTLRGTRFFRCHIKRKEDLDRLRQELRRNTSEQNTRGRDLADAFSSECKNLKISWWWDSANQPDCEICCPSGEHVLVLDETSGIVYVALGG